MKNNSFFKKLELIDYVFVIVMLFLFFLHLNMVFDLKSLPSPLYGGDLYNHLGSMEHIYQGGSVFESGQMISEIQWVPWLYHFYVVIFSKLTNIELMHSVWYSSLLLWLFGSIILYIFVVRFFNDKILGVLSIIWLFIVAFPIMKYNNFGYYIILPLFYLAAYLFLKYPSILNALLFGLSYGLVGLSNTHAMIAATFFLLFHIIYFYIYSEYRLNKNLFSIFSSKKFFLVLTAVIVGIALSMLWWFKPVFVYKIHTINDMQIYGFPELASIEQMINIVWFGLKNSFFNFSNIFYASIGLGALISIFILLFVKKKSVEQKFLLIMISAQFFGLISHFITIPLFKTHLGPEFLFTRTVPVTFLFLFLFFIYFLLRKYFHKSSFIVYGAILLLFLGGLYIHYRNTVNSEYWINSKYNLPPEYLELRSWILENTGLYDVFITNNEDSFMFNAITGRKVVTYRRTHSPSYTDMDQRMLDTALILYGKNDSLRDELIKKYNITYLLWTNKWIRNEFMIDPTTGRVSGLFDPLIIKYTPEREKILIDNEVKYTRINWYLDPTWYTYYPKYDLLLLMPDSFDHFQPWSSGLNSKLFLVKDFTYNNQQIFKIYAVKK